MADVKITALPARATVVTTDVVPVVDAASGVPATQKATVAQLRAAMMPIVDADVSATAAIAGTKIATTPASAIAALNIDWSMSGVYTKTLAAGVNTFTFSNAASGMCIIVRLTGAVSTVAWPTVKWAGGAAPVQTASGTDIYTFVHDGTSIYGSVVQAMA
jgi:hypothetical protein